jgi:hypothetical protein
VTWPAGRRRRRGVAATGHIGRGWHAHAPAATATPPRFSDRELVALSLWAPQKISCPGGMPDEREASGRRPARSPSLQQLHTTLKAWFWDAGLPPTWSSAALPSLSIFSHVMLPLARQFLRSGDTGWNPQRELAVRRVGSRPPSRGSPWRGSSTEGFETRTPPSPGIRVLARTSWPSPTRRNPQDRHEPHER